MTSGPRFLFWVDRYKPYIVRSMTTAASGKVATVKMPTSGNKGKPMTVNFSMVSASQLNTWCNSTGVFTVLGQQVIFAPQNGLVYENEVIKDCDAGTIDLDGFDYFRGTLNLIIVG